jgi:hypothetical protein
MPKPHSDSLFQLIQALSKSEKRAFKIYAQRIGSQEEKKIILLFNRIAKQKSYNEKEVLKKEKSLRREQMPNLKAHLFAQIMKCLSLGSYKQTDREVTVLISHTRILYNKCLYAEAFKMAEKAKHTAIKNDNMVLLLEILEMEKLIIKHTAQEGNEARVQAIIDQTDKTAESIKNINIFSNLSIKLHSLYQRTGFIRNEQDYKNVRNYFNSSLPEYTEATLSFHEKLYLYYSYTGYCFFIHDFKKGYVYAKKLAILFESTPEMIYRKGEFYIRALNNLLSAQHKLNLYAEFYETHKKLIALKRDAIFHKTENINLNLFKTIYLHEINRHYMLGEFTAGTRIIKKLETELENFIPILDHHTVLVFYYKIACLYFGANSFKAAVKWLNKIINEKEVELREDIHSFSRILRLISYFELGDTELVEYSIKSTYRFLLKKGNLQKYHLSILHFLKQAQHLRTKEKQTQAFSSLKMQMEKIKTLPYERREFFYFDILSWLESKIEKRTVESVIKEKVIKKRQCIRKSLL